MKRNKIILGMLLSCMFASQAVQADGPQYNMRLYSIGVSSSGATPPDVTPPDVTPPAEPPGDPSAWMAFFNSKNTLTNIASLDEWAPKMKVASLISRSINNGMLPQTPFGLSKIGALDLSNNNLTNISFMAGVTGFTGPLQLRINPITSLAPMSGITRLDYDVRIETTALTSLSGLENVTYVRNLTFYDNRSLRDISALANVAVMDYGTSDSPSQYTVKPAFGTPFCNGLSNGTVRVNAYSNGIRLTAADLCQ